MRANLDDILVRLQSSNHENVLGIRRAAETLQRGSQQDIRDLCGPWGVKRYENRKNRSIPAIKKDLLNTLVRCGQQHLNALEFDLHASIDARCWRSIVAHLTLG